MWLAASCGSGCTTAAGECGSSAWVLVVRQLCAMGRLSPAASPVGAPAPTATSCTAATTPPLNYSMPGSHTFEVLAGLTTLQLYNTPESATAQGWKAAVTAALRRLPQLRQLELVGFHGQPAALPARALASLGQLTALSCRMPWTPRPKLPSHGPWLASLRRIAVAPNVEAASPRMLAACSQLERLAVAGEWPGALALTLENLALVPRCALVDLPTLRHLTLGCCGREEAAGWRGTLVILQIMRPALFVSCTVGDCTQPYSLLEE